MKQPQKSFLPSKKQLMGCLSLFLMGIAIIIIMSFAKGIAKSSPLIGLFIGVFCALLWFLFWLYGKRRRKNQ